MIQQPVSATQKLVPSPLLLETSQHVILLMKHLLCKDSDWIRVPHERQGLDKAGLQGQEL